MFNVATAGAFKLAKDSPLTLEPLIETGAQSALIPSSKMMMLSDASTLREGFEPGGKAGDRGR